MTKAIRWTPLQLFEHQRKLDLQRKELGKLAENSRGIVTVAAPPAKKPAKAAPKKPTKKRKYKNRKVEKDGLVHDSEKEARRWGTLNIMQMAGKISELRRQVPFELAPAVRLEGEARKKPAIRYVSDFCYMENGVLIVEDCKSPPTRKLPAYRLKRHLMATVLNIQIKEV